MCVSSFKYEPFSTPNISYLGKICCRGSRAPTTYLCSGTKSLFLLLACVWLSRRVKHQVYTMRRVRDTRMCRESTPKAFCWGDLRRGPSGALGAPGHAQSQQVVGSKRPAAALSQAEQAESEVGSETAAATAAAECSIGRCRLQPTPSSLSSPCSARDLARCTCWIAQKRRARRHILSLPPTASILAVCARYFAAGVLVYGGEPPTTVRMEGLGWSDIPAYYPLIKSSIFGDLSFKSWARTSVVLTFPHIIR